MEVGLKTNTTPLKKPTIKINYIKNVIVCMFRIPSEMVVDKLSFKLCAIQ